MAMTNLCSFKDATLFILWSSLIAVTVCITLPTFDTTIFRLDTTVFPLDTSSFYTQSSIASSTAYPIYKMKDFDFANKLRNPCGFTNTSVFQSDDLFGDNSTRHAVQQRIIAEFVRGADDMLERVHAVMSTSVLCDCTTLHLNPVSEIPSADDLLEFNITDVYTSFFPSLLNHTAYVYFMADRLQRYSENLACNTTNLQQNVNQFAVYMRDLTCKLRLAIKAIANETGESSVEDETYFEAATNRTLNLEVQDVYICSRRAILDCQIVSSTLKFVAEMTNFLRNATLY